MASLFVHRLWRRQLLEFVAPDWRLVNELFSNVGLLVLGTLARMGTYTVMTAAATSMGVVPGAAHKVRGGGVYEGSQGRERVREESGGCVQDTETWEKDPTSASRCV